MISWFRIFPARLLPAMAAGLLVVSYGWMWRQQAALRRLRAQPVVVRLPDSPYVPTNWRQIDSVPAAWSQPAAQSPGAGWIFEVFTPPAFSYDAVTRSYAVQTLRHAGKARSPCGLELIGVRRKPYRLQLAGYFGGPDGYVAAFTSPGLSGTMLVREGARLEKFGLTLKSLVVQQVAVAANDAGPVREVRAMAVVRDEQTGAEVELVSGIPQFTDQPLAEFKLPGREGRVCELSEGETVSDEVFNYRVAHIQLSPPEVLVVRLSPGLVPAESQILRPVARQTPRSTSAKSASFSEHLPTRLAASGN